MGRVSDFPEGALGERADFAFHAQAAVADLGEIETGDGHTGEHTGQDGVENGGLEEQRTRGHADDLRAADYHTAHGMLTAEFGIGRKVADCVCLFGLHHVEAFPVDTHVKQIVNAYYPGGFPLERYRGYAGILQQYMFYYKLNDK